MATYKDVAFHLALARENAGKTQAEAAEFLGVTYGAVSNWERGHSKVDSVSLLRLLIFYGADIYDFMESCGFAVLHRVDHSDDFLSADAKEVAHSYAMLETIPEKNMIRNSLKLPPLDCEYDIEKIG